MKSGCKTASFWRPSFPKSGKPFACSSFVFRHGGLLLYVGWGSAAVGFVIRVVAADNQGGVIVACAGWVRRSCNPTGEGDSAGLGAVW